MTDTQPGTAPDPVQLLVGALGGLSDSDRDAVYAWLLRHEHGGAGGYSPFAADMAAALAGASPAASARRRATAVLGQQLAMTASGQQVVPVRFPAGQHAQLRQWCSEHGFSMATVVRGLVARFLEGQLPASGAEA